MKVFVTGANGQLGSDVIKALKQQGHEAIGSDLTGAYALDITNREAVLSMLMALRPDAVIHCAAWTAVEAAEDAENRDKVRLINVQGTRNIAESCKIIGCKMMYISTDYVFSGTDDKPWETDDPTEPLNIYGQTKLEGELAVRELIEKYYIVRTSWIIGEHGSNFVKTMLRLAENHRELRVVDDQIGSPTFTVELAPLLCNMIETEKYGIYHATNEGFCSWAELAEAVFRLAGKDVAVRRVSTEEYGAKAIRPKNSRLSKASLDAGGFSRLPVWETSLARMMEKEKSNERTECSPGL